MEVSAGVMGGCDHVCVFVENKVAWALAEHLMIF